MHMKCNAFSTFALSLVCNNYTLFKLFFNYNAVLLLMYSNVFN